MSKRTNHNHAGPGGSPFPPLGLAASGAAAMGSPSHDSAHPPHLSAGSRSSSSLSIHGGDPQHHSHHQHHHNSHHPNGHHHHHHHHHSHQNHQNHEGLPPASSKVDPVAAQKCRLQDAYWSEDEEDLECPLCLEEIDLSDANFKPCPCGYQICRFCWHHIKQNLNGRCPACRRRYSDQTVEFKPMSSEEIKRLTMAKKQKEREKKELESMNRKHLANMRVVQKNLVYVVGLSSKLAKEELIPTLRSNEYFGQYGRISKILISKRTTASKLVMGTSESNIGVYVTYHRKEDAARAIVAIDGSKGQDGKILRASYGTTKYCTTYLRNLPCTNPACTYLHEPGEEADSFTKEDLSTLRHTARDLENKSPNAAVPPASSTIAARQAAGNAISSPASVSAEAVGAAASSLSSAEEASALPKTASWASGKPGASATLASASNGILKDSDLPPLSANASLTRTSSSSKIAKQPAVPSATSSPLRSASIPTAPKGSRAPSSTAALPTENQKAASIEPGAPPGLSAPVSAASSSSSPVVAARAASNSTAGSSTPGPAVPPGLEKPPGLSPSPAAGSTPAYQPSASAQALMDDMRLRRESEAEQPHLSPFPDFDNTLSNLCDGDFSFNFPGMSKHVSEGGKGPEGSQASSLGAFVPFGSASLFGGSSSGLSTPNGTATPSNFSTTAYSGSFDPFSSEQTSFGGSSMTKGMDSSADQGDGQGVPADEAHRASRFDFAKPQGEGSASSSPQAAERPELPSDDGPIGFSKDVSGILGSVFDHDSGVGSQNAHNQQHRETNIYGRATQAQAQAAQQAAQAQAQAQAQHAVAAAAAQHQQHHLHQHHQQHMPGHHQHHQQQQQQQHRAGPPGLSGAYGIQQQQQQNPNWYYELQQQRQQQAANHFGGGGGGGGGNGSHYSASTPSNSSEPLLAQLMAAAGGARRNVFGDQNGQMSGNLPSGDYYDGLHGGAMSMGRGQQQQQQQQHVVGDGSGFSPFDHHGRGSGTPGSAFHRSPYSTMS